MPVCASSLRVPKLLHICRRACGGALFAITGGIAPKPPEPCRLQIYAATGADLYPRPCRPAWYSIAVWLQLVSAGGCWQRRVRLGCSLQRQLAALQEKGTGARLQDTAQRCT